MSSRIHATLTPIVAGLLLAGAAHAQTATTSGSTAATTTPNATARADAKAAAKLDRADAAFLRDAAESGLMEVEASKLAATKAVNTQVKSFAQQMVDDHSKANEELMTLAGQKGVELPKEPSMAQKARLKQLEGSDGANFDKRYAEVVGVKAHEDAVKKFRKASKDAKDAEVKAWATKTLPQLEAHLKQARELKAVADKEGKSAASARDGKTTASADRKQ